MPKKDSPLSEKKENPAGRESKLPLSVAFIALNEEENLPRTLEAVKDIASQIVLIDSFSQDKTPEIARRYGAEVFTEEWKGFTAQKNSLIEKCKQEWILFLDCDEVVTEELKQNLRKVLKNPPSEINGYFINRKTVYLGKVLNYAWQPDRKLRLVRRSASPKWKGEIVHEYLTVQGKTDKLQGTLLHFSYKNLFHHYTASVKYARLSAESYLKRGKKFKFYKLLFNPAWGFIKELFIKRGFLDGTRGLSVAVSHALTTFLKYLFLWEKTKIKEERSRK